MRALLIPLICLSGLAFAQAPSPTSGDGARGSTPPGMSQDGARPADGAIKGGTILPGEKAGMPADKDAAGGGTSSAERVKRCDELSGMLREQCLEKERSAAGGAGAPTAPQKFK